jgi:hypothetical protein
MKQNNYTELTPKQELTIYGIVLFLLCTIIILDYINIFTN